MAVDFSAPHKRTSEYNFAPEDISVRAELNGRHELPDISWLVQDILAHGQLQPVIIRNDGGTPVLVAGFSRWRAISEINSKSLAPVALKVRCTYFRGNEREAFLANISENRYRNATTPLDDAHNIARLERWGMSVEEIAEHYREKPVWVAGRLSLLSLEDSTREAVKRGKIKTTAAVEIAKLSAEKQREVTKRAEAGETVKAADVRAERTGKARGINFPEVKEYLRLVADKSAILEVKRFAADLLDRINGGAA